MRKSYHSINFFCTFPAEVVSVNLFSFQQSKTGRKKQVDTDGCQQSDDCS